MTALRDLVPGFSTAGDDVDPRRPRLTGLVTPDWLSARLDERHPGTVVETVALGDVVSGASTKGFVTVGYAAGGNPDGLPTELVVKGGFEDHSARTAFTHLNEMRFYREIAPTAPIDVPACYYAGREPVEGLDVVVLENLDGRGVTFNTVFETFSYAEVSRGLDALARYHAATWNTAELEPGGRLDWVQDTIGGEFGSIHDYFFDPVVWARFVRKPQFQAVSTRFHDAGAIREGLQRLGEYQRSMDTLCVVHGDCHQGNTYTLPDGTIGFLDFQTKKTPWVQDVTEFIVGTTDITTRRVWERDLLRDYLRRLRGHGVDAPDVDTAWAAHRRQVLYGLFKWLINEQVWQIEAINTANSARYGAACLDHDTLELLLGRGA